MVPRLSPFGRRLLLLTLLGLVVRVGYVLVVEQGDEITGDATYYHTAANLLADGKGFIEPYRYLHGGGQEYLFVEDESLIDPSANTALPIGHEEPTAGHPPLFVLLLGAGSLVGFRTVLEHQLISALIGAAAIPLIGLVGRDLAGERAGLIAAFLGATYGFLWLNDGMIMSESLVIVLAAACSLAALRFARGPSMRRALVLGVLGGLGALTRAEIALFLPVVLGWMLLRSGLPWKRRIGLFAASGAVAVAVVSPWVIRNLSVFEEPVLLSNGSGIVLVQANCDATYYGDKQGYWEYLCGLPQPVGPNGEPIDESQRDVQYRERGMEYISNHTERLLTHVVPVRMLRIWALYDPVQQLRADVLVEGRAFRLSVLALVQFAVLVPLAVAGGVLLWRRKEPLFPVAVWPLLVTFVAATAFATTRYRVTAEVAIVILAAVALDALWARAVRGRSAGAT